MTELSLPELRNLKHSTVVENGPDRSDELSLGEQQVELDEWIEGPPAESRLDIGHSMVNNPSAEHSVYSPVGGIEVSEWNIQDQAHVLDAVYGDGRVVAISTGLQKQDPLRGLVDGAITNQPLKYGISSELHNVAVARSREQDNETVSVELVLTGDTCAHILTDKGLSTLKGEADPEGPYDSTTIILHPGDSLVLSTDSELDNRHDIGQTSLSPSAEYGVGLIAAGAEDRAEAGASDGGHRSVYAVIRNGEIGERRLTQARPEMQVDDNHVPEQKPGINTGGSIEEINNRLGEEVQAAVDERVERLRDLVQRASDTDVSDSIHAAIGALIALAKEANKTPPQVHTRMPERVPPQAPRIKEMSVYPDRFADVYQVLRWFESMHLDDDVEPYRSVEILDDEYGFDENDPLTTEIMHAAKSIDELATAEKGDIDTQKATLEPFLQRIYDATTHDLAGYRRIMTYLYERSRIDPLS